LKINIFDLIFSLSSSFKVKSPPQLEHTYANLLTTYNKYNITFHFSISQYLQPTTMLILNELIHQFMVKIELHKCIWICHWEWCGQWYQQMWVCVRALDITLFSLLMGWRERKL